MKWIGFAAAGIALLLAAMALVGAMLPEHHLASRSATFKRPVEEVYALLVDVQRGPEWRTGLERVEVQPAEGGPLRFKETGSQGPIAMELVERVPNQRLVTRIADDSLPFGGGWTFELQPAAGGGTRLTITERGQVKNALFRFMSRFIFGHTATLDQYLRDVGRRFGEDAQPEPGSATPATGRSGSP